MNEQAFSQTSIEPVLVEAERVRLVDQISNALDAVDKSPGLGGLTLLVMQHSVEAVRSVLVPPRDVLFVEHNPMPHGFRRKALTLVMDELTALRRRGGLSS